MTAAGDVVLEPPVSVDVVDMARLFVVDVDARPDPTIDVVIDDITAVDVQETVFVVEVNAVSDISGPPGPAGPAGPAGEAGPPGPTGGAYTFTQGTPASVWVITHPLGYPPAVTVVDSTGEVVEGNVVFVGGAQVNVTFSAAFSGVAYLS